MTIKNPLVIGLGGVGSLVVRFLHQAGMEVAGMDKARPAHAPSSLQFIQGDVTHSAELTAAMKGRDAVIACVPFHLTLTIAEAAHKAGLHYFDLTEDVATTEAVRALAASGKGVMIPQNGLAPGFIGIIGAHLAALFDEGGLRDIKLRVGALPQNPIGQLGYAGNWSLEGLIHEYIAECDVIENGQRKKVPPLRLQEILRIHGVEYEAFTTSGGLGTMTETYAGKVETLNYKSIRYPGHLAGMQLLLEELRFKENPDALIPYIRNALPPDEHDCVLIHASVQGEIKGKLQTKEFVANYKPITLGERTYPAIAWTTAASLCAVVEMVSAKTLPQKGFVKQEDIPLMAFLNTPTGKLYRERCEHFPF